MVTNNKRYILVVNRKYLMPKLWRIIFF
jgi:hypothetical protein